MAKSLSRAIQLYIRRFPFLIFMQFMMLVVTLGVCAPLLALVHPSAKPVALLAPVLFVFLFLPIRQNMADVLRELDENDACSPNKLIDFSNYGQKLKLGVRTLMFMLLWSIPFLGATGYALYIFTADTAVTGMDAFTLIRVVLQMGNGSFTTGLVVVAALYLLTAVPILFGFAFHSGTRHARAMGNVRLAGQKRGITLLGWLISLVTFVPFLASAAVICRDYVSQLIASVSNIMSASFTLPPIDQDVYLLLVAFVILCLPLMPLRALIPACILHKAGEKK